MPQFGGTRGPAILKSLLENEKAFQRNLEKLRTLDYDALDVRATRWHEDFNTQFKSSTRDLEVMTQNIINNAFDSVSTVMGGVELLEAFAVLARCESIKRCVEKKVTDVLASFTNFVNGMEILKQVLTQLLLYYSRFQDIIRKAWKRPPAFTKDIIPTSVILNEIARYSRSF